MFTMSEIGVKMREDNCFTSFFKSNIVLLWALLYSTVAKATVEVTVDYSVE